MNEGGIVGFPAELWPVALWEVGNKTRAKCQFEPLPVDRQSYGFVGKGIQ